MQCLREAAKKSSPLNGSGPGRAIKEKKLCNPFFQRSNVQTAINKLEGGGLGLNGPAIKRRTFFYGFPNKHSILDEQNKNFL